MECFGAACGKEKPPAYEYEYTGMVLRVEEQDARLGDVLEWKNSFGELEEKFGGEIWIHDRESMAHLMYWFAAGVGEEMLMSEAMLKQSHYGYPSENETAISSFSIYLVDTYGEDFLYLVATGNDKVQELTGYTYEELEQGWEKYLEENYGLLRQ